MQIAFACVITVSVVVVVMEQLCVDACGGGCTKSLKSLNFDHICDDPCGYNY